MAFNGYRIEDDHDHLNSPQYSNTWLLDSLPMASYNKCSPTKYFTGQAIHTVRRIVTNAVEDPIAIHDA